MIKRLEKKYQIDVMCTTKDRHSEMYGAIQSLRTQKFTKWNLLILDDSSGTPLINHGPTMAIINRLRLEGHMVKIVRNNISYGVCSARNSLIKYQQEWNTASNLCFRLDDDVLLESDYLLKLVKVIDIGYDLASGVIPLLAYPEIKRENKFIGKIINEHELDKEGNLIKNEDDCSFCYMEEQILPTHQFRTHVLYKTKIHKKIKYPENLSKVGFREEGFFSFKAIIAGYKLGVHTGAVAYHLMTNSGGVRCADYNDNVKLDDETFRKWLKEQFKEHGDFIQKYNKEVLQWQQKKV